MRAVGLRVVLQQMMLKCRYEALGIGSSYFFRVNDFEVTDATMTGNLARFACSAPRQAYA